MKVAELIEKADRARSRALAPYSGFTVGAALESKSGRVFTGCNIESSSYGLTVCAERVALWKALSEGEHQFRRVVVVAGTSVPTPPCGACRQVLWEYCGDIGVLLADAGAVRARYRLSELLPSPFDARILNER